MRGDATREGPFPVKSSFGGTEGKTSRQSVLLRLASAGLKHFVATFCVSTRKYNDSAIDVNNTKMAIMSMMKQEDKKKTLLFESASPK